MSVQGHNRLRGRDLYMEVRDIIRASDRAVSNIDIRDVLLQRYAEANDERVELYERVRRATEQLHQSGYIERTVAIGRTKADVYLYTHTTETCSSERK